MVSSDYTINVRGRLVSLAQPMVMGILNATPDSFLGSSRSQTSAEISRRAQQIVAEGGAIIDVGACSTRPGGALVSETKERSRLRLALETVRRVCPDAIVSVDTFRPDVARMAVEECGANIINDISGGSEEMFKAVGKLGVPYILTSQEATLEAMMKTFAASIQALRNHGAKDIILDPGFGFGKTLDDNFAIMARMERLSVLGLPLLVGVSHKRMVYETLATTPEETLNGTTALHSVALMKGANILRTHDVKATMECVKLTEKLRQADRVNVSDR